MPNEPLQVAGLTAAPGQRAAGIVSTIAAGVKVEMPLFLVNGAHPGPTLAVTAGVHGAEYASIEAALRLRQTLDPGTLHGRAVIAPVANPPAFTGRSIYVAPPDGKNLNRQFPGYARGTFSPALAYWLFENIIRLGDAYVDLHGGDLIEALEPFAICFFGRDEKTSQASLALARAFGIRYVLQEDAPGIGADAAAKAGIPAILPEAGGQGIWNEESVGILFTGMQRVLAHLGMITAALPAPEPPVMLTKWEWMRSSASGAFYPAIRVGERVRAGQDVGRVADLFGQTLQSVAAPIEGVVLFAVSSLAINSGDPLLAIAA